MCYRWHYRLLALAWSSPGNSGHLQGEAMDQQMEELIDFFIIFLSPFLYLPITLLSNLYFLNEHFKHKTQLAIGLILKGLYITD